METLKVTKRILTNSDFIRILKDYILSEVEEKRITDELFILIKERVLENASTHKQFKEKDVAEKDVLYETAVKEFLSIYPVDIDPVTSLTKKGFKTWLTEDRKKKMPMNYIDRYLQLLEKESRSERVIEEIRDSSEKILGKLGDPELNQPFYVKGLVVGSVQSGKTGNFNAVINRAVDAGYSLIIVLSGIMEDLRGQTQLRIESDVIGEGTVDIQTGLKDIKGVGEIKFFGEQGDKNIPQVFSITSYKSDFGKEVRDADFSLNNKYILICKKNPSILKNLLRWLSDYLNENKEKHNIPLLIVDDEADNASLNNMGKKGLETASIINGHIRAILALFTRKTYLGYTATPFANVLQDRNGEAEGKWEISYKSNNGQSVLRQFDQVNNIFPDDFIELLSPPSNYIGAKQIFETVLDETAKKIPLVVPIHDHEQAFPSKVFVDVDKSIKAAGSGEKEEGVKLRSPVKDDPFPKFLPDSLKDAIDCFILTIALRTSRKPSMVNSKLYNPHHTMLVHISRFSLWQNATKKLIEAYIKKLREDLENDGFRSPDSVYARFEKIWNKYYAVIVENIRSYLPSGYSDEFLTPKKFYDIRDKLSDAVDGIEVKAVNSVAKEKLVYTKNSSGDGKKYIAVGGNRLSRGFTLEGLTINYFIRNTNYSDTLLQMGRWFGYRPGYLDCCKLFTTTDAIEKYDSTTRAIEELEAEFKRMNRENKTPRDFVLRVRKHPGTLKITRPSILKNVAEVKWSYQDHLIQTTKFKLEPTRIQKAWESFNGLIGTYSDRLQEIKEFYGFEADVDDVIRFLELDNTFHNYSEDLAGIKRFIQLCKEKNKLTKWTIAIRRKGDRGKRKLSDLNVVNAFPSNFDVQLTTRRGPDTEEPQKLLRDEFVNNKIFSASGKSANIVTRGSDLALILTDEEMKEAELQFKEERKQYFIEDKKMSATEAEEEVCKIKTMPESIYRRKMGDDHALLLIYLMDTKFVFRQDENDDELKTLAEREGFDLNIPLIGYALGFPPINPDPGGVYVHGDYDLEDDEEEVDEPDEENDQEEN